MDTAPVHLVAALPAEVKPIVTRFELERIRPEQGFPVYRNQRISLVMSGVGKVNAAAASAFLYALNGCRKNAIWINLGIAGHRALPLGETVLARRITDVASGRYWRPTLTIHAPCDTVDVETLDQPNFDYFHDAAFDMEASGFCAIASRFSAADKVHCLKVISDNQHSPGETVSASTVRRMMSGSLDLLEQLIVRLSTPENQAETLDAQLRTIRSS